MIEFIKKQDVLDKIMSVADGERYLPPMIDAVNAVPTYICTGEEEKDLQNAVSHYNRLEKAVDFYGNKQISKTVEEMGELLTLLGRVQIGEVNKLDLIGEIADVYNMLDQLCIIFDIEDTVHNMSEYKMLTCINQIENAIEDEKINN